MVILLKLVLETIRFCNKNYWKDSNFISYETALTKHQIYRYILI